MNIRNLLLILITLGSYHFLTAEKSVHEYPKSMASYSDFAQLVDEVQEYRKLRLLSLDHFLAQSKKENTIILDTRSRFRYERKHLKGAINLPFSDFTQMELAKIIPNPDMTVLIYCNNNFRDDPINFPTKLFIPSESSLNEDGSSQFNVQQKPVMLALNIPTFINLYGYGYRNIYELDEFVDVKDARIKFEGSLVD